MDERRWENSPSSFEHSGQIFVPRVLNLSHCPQTMPISCCSVSNVSSRSSAILGEVRF